MLSRSTKPMTLNLSEIEMRLVEELATRKGMNKTALMKQALRLFQTIEERISRGEKLYFEDGQKQKSELVIL